MYVYSHTVLLGGVYGIYMCTYMCVCDEAILVEFRKAFLNACLLSQTMQDKLLSSMLLYILSTHACMRVRVWVSDCTYVQGHVCSLAIDSRELEYVQSSTPTLSFSSAR